MNNGDVRTYRRTRCSGTDPSVDRVSIERRWTMHSWYLGTRSMWHWWSMCREAGRERTGPLVWLDWQTGTLDWVHTVARPHIYWRRAEAQRWLSGVLTRWRPAEVDCPALGRGESPWLGPSSSVDSACEPSFDRSDWRRVSQPGWSWTMLKTSLLHQQICRTHWMQGIWDHRWSAVFR